MTTDPISQETIMREVLKNTAEMNMTQPPPLLAALFYRWLHEKAGGVDFYQPVRERFNRLVLDLLPELERRIDASADPVAAALRFSIAGNMIDFGINGGVTEEEVLKGIEHAFQAPFYGNIDDFRHAIRQAHKILYLADNAGEIVLDRLLIERLPKDRVVLAVRGCPVINDATMADAEAVGLTSLVKVIDNGSDVPGTAVSQCNHEFQRCFSEADLIIAKGQGNFETLSEEPGNIFFLFTVKCPVVSAEVGLPVGTQVLLYSAKPAISRQLQETGVVANSSPPQLIQLIAGLCRFPERFDPRVLAFTRLLCGPQIHILLESQPKLGCRIKQPGQPMGHVRAHRSLLPYDLINCPSRHSQLLS